MVDISSRRIFVGWRKRCGGNVVACTIGISMDAVSNTGIVGDIIGSGGGVCYRSFTMGFAWISRNGF